MLTYPTTSSLESIYMYTFCKVERLINVSQEISLLPQTQTDTIQTAMPATPIITVEKLVKRYKKAEKNAVDSISFSVAPGTLFALLGPNGAGKTTTISI